MERFIVFILTALFLAGLGTAMKNMVSDGQYWVLLAVPVLALIGGWYVGDEADKQGYRDAGNWIREKLRRRSRGQSHLEPPTE